MRKGEWMTKEKENILIKDMGDGHLFNTAKLLIRKATLKLARDVNMLFIFPEVPDEYVAELAESTVDDYLSDKYFELTDELIRREKYDLLDSLDKYASSHTERGHLAALSFENKRP